MTLSHAQPFTRSTDEGEALWLNGALVLIKASEEQTGGGLAAVEFRTLKGFAAPLHVHRNDDELFLVLWGEVRFQLGDEVVEGTPDTLVFGPRGVAHSFAVDSDEARLLLLFGPAGTEKLFREVGRPALSLELPTAEQDAPLPDPGVLIEIASRHGQDIVGPPLPPLKG
jgi:quercetin dioxygenase-like cupin family protein